jgi:hypothetical protein
VVIEAVQTVYRSTWSREHASVGSEKLPDPRPVDDLPPAERDRGFRPAVGDQHRRIGQHPAPVMPRYGAVHSTPRWLRRLLLVEFHLATFLPERAIRIKNLVRHALQQLGISLLPPPPRERSLTQMGKKRLAAHRAKSLQQIQQPLVRLLQLKNPDGGIPAGNDGDESGPWTTAMTLLAACEADLVHQKQKDLLGMVEFLIASYVSAKPTSSGLTGVIPPGGWPIVAGPISTMSTGHCVAALSTIASTNLIQGRTLTKIYELISGAHTWLADNQFRSNGGWAVGSQAEQPEDARIIATFYALAAFRGETPQTSAIVRRATQFLMRQQDEVTGGWRDPGVAGSRTPSPTASDTARAITALLNFSALDASSRQITSGIDYLNRAYEKTRTWGIQKVSLRVRNAPGETVVNNNSVCDVVLAMGVSRKTRSHHYEDAIRVLLSTVDPYSGLWLLSDGSENQPITTWPTADWALALLAANREGHLPITISARRAVIRPRTFRAVSATLVATSAFSCFLFRARLGELWDALSDTTRSLILTAVILAIGVGFAANALYDAVKAMLRKLAANRNGRRST